MKHINVGDHVRAVINTSPWDVSQERVYNLKITKIFPTRGFSIVNNKRVLNSPVITGIPLDDETSKCDCRRYRKGEADPTCISCRGTGVVSKFSCNSSWITDILKKEKQKLGIIKNIYKNEACFMITDHSKLYSPHFESLVIYVLRNLSINVTRRIDFKKALELYKKNAVGLKQMGKNGSWYDIRISNTDNFIVDKKKFKKWVLKNLSAIYVPVNDLHKAQNKRDKEYEDDYWKSVDDEYKKELNNSKLDQRLDSI